MALAHYYRILGLRTGAGFGDVKLAYRNLARLYHPDTNPGDQLAKEKFIQVTQAYQALVNSLPPGVLEAQKATAPVRVAKPPTPIPTASTQAPPAQTCPTPAAADVELTVSPTPGGSEADQQLKVNSFKQLRGLFQEQRFPRAVALVEGLAQRFPEDPEIRQWHAITYYRWGHELLNQGNPQKAEACLKKAHRVDPQNRSLRQALHHDFQRLEKLSQRPMAQAQ
ncbi:DnaJ domain-containing protein [Leptolyngbya sp. CCNP1308]|uniref:DnaJ domain-containing protein n=1 Tax=Leptolyngbya sp. CCNP1308 TaxID=3110255 RepID=UPI002B1F8948|nr:DnaJ domain-containing protein [Leptolyngbya sp. CCNP1308]MEA5451299.1 DnaJ domain-containing protein [Leptolyngbya sp. CCNP1308]